MIQSQDNLQERWRKEEEEEEKKKKKKLGKPKLWKLEVRRRWKKD